MQEKGRNVGQQYPDQSPECGAAVIFTCLEIVRRDRVLLFLTSKETKGRDQSRHGKETTISI